MARRVDLRVVNGGTPDDGEWPMSLVLDGAEPLAGGPPRALASFAPGPVHAVAGIGHPERFFDALRAEGIEVVPHPFSDHHDYAARDLAFAPRLPHLTTEKDAVKWPTAAREDAWAVPARAQLPAGFFDALHGLLAARRSDAVP